MYKILIGFITGALAVMGAHFYLGSKSHPEGCICCSDEVEPYEPYEPQSNLDQATDKQENLELLERYIRIHQPVRSREVTELLGVTPRTARNYFNELIEEEVIEQHGETGRGVRYSIKR